VRGEGNEDRFASRAPAGHAATIRYRRSVVRSAWSPCSLQQPRQRRFAAAYVFTAATSSWGRTASLVLMSLQVAATGCYGSTHVLDADAGGDALGPPVESFPDFSPDQGDALCSPVPSSPFDALEVQVRTTAPGGRFKPRNVGAVWIEAIDGRFVRTLERWGVARAKYLRRYQATQTDDAVDAITGPTLKNHVLHVSSWDWRDGRGCEVEDGEYRVVFEVTDNNSSGPTLEVPFTKGSAAVEIETAEGVFFDVSLQTR
jgi:hypothetical protein